MSRTAGNKPDATRLAGVLLVALSATGFGALGILVKFAYAAGTSIVAVLFLRFLIGGLAMVVLMPLVRLSWPRGRDLLILIGMGAIGYVGQAFCYFSALRHTSAGLTALLLYLYPALVTLAATALGRQRLTWFKGAAVAATMAGILLTVGDGLTGSLTGILYGTGAAVIYTGYILVGERVTQRTGAIPAATVIMLAAAAVYGMMAATADGVHWPAGVQGWLAMAGIAFLSTVVAMIGFFAGMQRLGATDAATISTLEPVVTLLLAYALLGEALTVIQLTGAGLVIAAVLALTRAGRQ